MFNRRRKEEEEDDAYSLLCKELCETFLLAVVCFIFEWDGIFLYIILLFRKELLYNNL